MAAMRGSPMTCQVVSRPYSTLECNSGAGWGAAVAVEGRDGFGVDTVTVVGGAGVSVRVGAGKVGRDSGRQPKRLSNRLPAKRLVLSLTQRLQCILKSPHPIGLSALGTKLNSRRRPDNEIPSHALSFLIIAESAPRSQHRPGPHCCTVWRGRFDQRSHCRPRNQLYSGLLVPG